MKTSILSELMLAAARLMTKKLTHALQRRTSGMKTKLNGLAVAASMSLFGINAHAISVGDSMSVNYRYPNQGTVIDSGQSFTVAPGGTTFTENFSGLNLDISVVGDTITVSLFNRMVTHSEPHQDSVALRAVRTAHQTPELLSTAGTRLFP